MSHKASSCAAQDPNAHGHRHSTEDKYTHPNAHKDRHPPLRLVVVKLLYPLAELAVLYSTTQHG